MALWEVPSGKPVRRFPDSPPIRAAVFSPDGGTLIAECLGPPANPPGDPFRYKKLLRHYRVSTGKLLREVEIERKADFNLDFPIFSADGTLLATSDGSLHVRDNKTAVRLWDVPSGKQRLPIEIRPHSMVASFALSADGKAWPSWTGEPSRVHDTATGKELGRFPWVPHKDDEVADGPHSVALSPNGKLLAASTLQSVRVGRGRRQLPARDRGLARPGRLLPGRKISGRRRPGTDAASGCRFPRGSPPL